MSTQEVSLKRIYWPAHLFLQIVWHALIDPSKVRNLGRNRKPVCVINVLKTQLLEHLTWLKVVINDPCCNISVLFSQSLWHKFDDQRSKSASLKPFINLEWPKGTHFDPQAPCDQLVVLFCESTNVHVHFDQSLNKVQWSVVLVRPQIVDLLAMFWNQLLQIDPIGSAVREDGFRIACD